MRISDWSTDVCSSDLLGAARGAAVQQDHAGMLGLDLVEGGPDAVMVLIVDAAGDEDARALGQEDLGLRAALGVDEVAAVDAGGGQGAVIDLGAGQRLPGRADAPLEELCRMDAHALDGIAPLDERQALAEQPLELDRAATGREAGR